MSAAPVYVPVPLFTLIGGSKLEFDLYVQLNSKHVLYLRSGGLIDADRLEKLRKRNVRYMWVIAAEMKRFRDRLEQRISQAFDWNSNLQALQRSVVIRGVLETSVEALIKEPKSEDRYRQAWAHARRLTNFFSKRGDQALSVVLAAPPTEKSVAGHGLNVAAIGLALVQKLGLGDPKDLPMFVLGCLVHDVGHYGQPKMGFGKSTKILGQLEITAAKQHPAVGANLFQGLSHIDGHVLNIILEHEEHIDGTGFPRGLKQKEMHPYSVIAAVANAFDHIVTFDNLSPQAAMKQVVVGKIGRYPLSHIEALKSIVQHIPSNH